LAVLIGGHYPTAGILGDFVFRSQDRFVLTSLGKKMSAFPLDPKFTKAILVAKDLGCTSVLFKEIRFLPDMVEN
jgi:hypothetical protein